MRSLDSWGWRFFPLLVLISANGIAASDSLPNTKPLAAVGDLSAEMVASIHAYLDRATADSVERRAVYWNRDLGSAEAYGPSIEPNRVRLRAMVGVVDERLPPDMQYVSGPDSPALIAETDRYRAFAVRWSVLDKVHGEGLLLEPKAAVNAQVIAIPDADQTPEMLVGIQTGISEESQYARKLAEAGCRVIVPALVDRQSTWSGVPDIAMTDQTHREWIYRQGHEVGRHVIGYEIQRILAAVDWLASRPDHDRLRLGVFGYGEGGLLALYASALDDRVDAAVVSGYFGRREAVWSEPIYRNVFGLLREFGDAELATMVAPRRLIIEHSEGPRAQGQPEAATGIRKCAAPGDLVTPTIESARFEVDRARRLCSSPSANLASIELIASDDGGPVAVGSGGALALFLQALDPSRRVDIASGTTSISSSASDDRLKRIHERSRRQVDELVEHSQRLLRGAELARSRFWKDAPQTNDLRSWQESTRDYKHRLWNDVVGRLPDPSLPADPRTRRIKATDRWTMYEVVLDVWPGVFAWGYLTVPNGIDLDERRPVVVCQHGLEGLPKSVVTDDPNDRDAVVYNAFAIRLAERGFVTYAPHNPYRGQDAFRQLQRKANPLGLTLYSFILGQHQQSLAWLKSLPFVDSERIAFYGLSYGGLSAVRIPSLLEDYSLSICSACFNDWTRKVMSLDFPASYMFTHEYEHYTFNLGNTFNHAELAALIAPRPFMVERGHRDGVAPDEWVAHEFAKVRRLYANLGIADRAAIEFFDGGHVIHSEGTFEFLHRHLGWPVPR